MLKCSLFYLRYFTQLGKVMDGKTYLLSRKKSSPDRFCNPGCFFPLKPLGYAATGSFTSSPKA
jgi:hypothetical protein